MGEMLLVPVWLGGNKVPPLDPLVQGTAPGKSKQQSGTILVVDDERLIADTLTAILEEHGFIAFTAYSGEEGLEVALKVHPDVVLTDVVMTGITGIELGVRVTQALENVRIVLLSGQASTADLMQQAAGNGHRFELLAKPIHPEELVAKLRQSLRFNR